MAVRATITRHDSEQGRHGTAELASVGALVALHTLANNRYLALGRGLYRVAATLFVAVVAVRLGMGPDQLETLIVLEFAQVFEALLSMTRAAFTAHAPIVRILMAGITSRLQAQEAVLTELQGGGRCVLVALTAFQLEVAPQHLEVDQLVIEAGSVLYSGNEERTRVDQLKIITVMFAVAQGTLRSDLVTEGAVQAESTLHMCSDRIVALQASLRHASLPVAMTTFAACP